MKIIANIERKLDGLLREADNFRYLNEIGVLLYQMKDFDNAELYLQRAYELNPLDKEILCNYALLLRRRLQLKEAVEIYNACLKLDPHDDKIKEKLIDLYYQLGEYEIAANYSDNFRKGESIWLKKDC